PLAADLDQQPFLLQVLGRQAHRLAADAELLGQLHLRRQPAVGEAPLRDRLPQQLLDARGQAARPVQPLELRRRLLRHARASVGPDGGRNLSSPTTYPPAPARAILPSSTGHEGHGSISDRMAAPEDRAMSDSPPQIDYD